MITIKTIKNFTNMVLLVFVNKYILKYNHKIVFINTYYGFIFYNSIFFFSEKNYT